MRLMATTILLVRINIAIANSPRSNMSAVKWGTTQPCFCFSPLTPTFRIQNKGEGLSCLTMSSGTYTNKNEDKLEETSPLNHLLLPSMSRIMSQNSYRIDSQTAASLIHHVYSNSSSADTKMKERSTGTLDSEESPTSDGTINKNEPTLIIITSDASRGSKRLLGLSTIIRTIYPISQSPSSSTCASTTTTTTRPSQEIVDTVTMATRRRQSPTHPINIVEAEIAAIALGLKLVLQQYPSQEQRQRVLVVSDCEGALQFYCGAKSSKQHVASSTVQHPHYRLWKMIQQPPSSKEFFYRDSILDMRWAKMTKVKSAHLGTSGFFDHEVADVLSSYAKGVSNKEAQRLGLFGSEMNERRGKKKSMKHSEAINATNTGGRQIDAPRLRLNDLEYLAYSEGISGVDSDEVDNNNTPKKQIQIKKESGERLIRCKSRMKLELDLNIEKNRR